MQTPPAAADAWREPVVAQSSPAVEHPCTRSPPLQPAPCSDGLLRRYNNVPLSFLPSLLGALSLPSPSRSYVMRGACPNV